LQLYEFLGIKQYISEFFTPKGLNEADTASPLQAGDGAKRFGSADSFLRIFLQYGFWPCIIYRMVIRHQICSPVKSAEVSLLLLLRR
jgi:hypothetical protein